MAKKEPANFETRLQRLQTVVEGLEQADLPLEKAMALYKEGVALVQSCRQELQTAKHDITIYSQSVFKPFEPESDGSESGPASVGAQE